jgi:hypothetical protein
MLNALFVFVFAYWSFLSKKFFFLGVEIRLPKKNRLAAAPGDYKSFCWNIKY